MSEATIEGRIYVVWKVQRFHMYLASRGIQLLDSDTTSGVCPRCEQMKENIAKRRLNTMYDDDSRNWLESCAECWDETIEYYRYLWAELL